MCCVYGLNQWQTRFIGISLIEFNHLFLYSKLVMDMKVVVIGGANIDVSAKCSYKMVPKDSNIGIVDFGIGGVGRNIAEALSLFGAEVSLLTALGNDSFGRVISDNADEQAIKLLEEPFEDGKTGVFTYIADSDGTFVTGVNDMEIIFKITPEVIRRHIKLKQKKQARMLKINRNSAK